jgi:hypothetical protein
MDGSKKSLAYVFGIIAMFFIMSLGFAACKSGNGANGVEMITGKDSGIIIGFPNDKNIVTGNNPHGTSYGTNVDLNQYVTFRDGNGDTEFVLPYNLYKTARDVAVSICDIVETGKMPDIEQLARYKLAMYDYMRYAYIVDLISNPGDSTLYWELQFMDSDYSDKQELAYRSGEEIGYLLRTIKDLQKYIYDPSVDEREEQRFDDNVTSDGYIQDAADLVYDDKYNFFNQKKYPNLYNIGLYITREANPNGLWRKVLTKETKFTTEEILDRTFE